MRRRALLALLALASALAACGADGPPVRPGTGRAAGEAVSLDLDP